MFDQPLVHPLQELLTILDFNNIGARVHHNVERKRRELLYESIHSKSVGNLGPPQYYRTHDA